MEKGQRSNYIMMMVHATRKEEEKSFCERIIVALSILFIFQEIDFSFIIENVIQKTNIISSMKL